MKDKADRTAIAEDLDTTLIVEAGAGTGKTTALVGRILALLRTGRATLSSIVAVTFTEKAAGEMKLRLRSEIERARQSLAPGHEERVRLDFALRELEATEIGTIHGFCANVLRQRPVAAQVDPLFAVADEGEQDRIYGEAFERWFQRELSEPSEGVRRILRRRGREAQGAGSPRRLLYDAGLRLVGQRDFSAPWERPVFAREKDLDGILVRFKALAELAPQAADPEHYFAESIRYIASVYDDIERLESVGSGRDYDGIEEALRRGISGPRRKVWTYKGFGSRFGGGFTTGDVAARRDVVYEEIRRVLRLADADLASCLQKDLRPLVDAYVEMLGKSGKVDFLDLLVRARDLLLENATVRDELRAKYTHILVDEFQDTDPLQAEILLALAGEVPGKIFIVGDPKQSIYRFRRADVSLYEGIKRDLLAKGARLVFLTQNFRSVPAVCSVVNGALSNQMVANAQGSQAAYVPIEAHRKERADMPGVIALPVPAPYSAMTGKVSTYYVGQSYPDAVGAWVEWLLRESGFQIAEKGGAPRPVRARDVCLLFRRLSSFGEDITRPYVRSLEARRIPHVLVGGRTFHAREEVLAVKNALAALEWPDDELSVYATLRGPFFALSDEALLTLRHVTGRALHPLRKVPPEKLDDTTKPVQDALTILGGLHRRRNRRPIADTITELLETTRAHAGVAFWPAGEQALANLLRFVDHARRFDQRGTTSFRAFVSAMEAEGERGGMSEAPVVEEGTDGVRLMTVHKAKGLEFPVVVLVDPACPLAHDTASRYVDAKKKLWAMPLCGAAPLELSSHEAEVLEADRDESLRLLYVAATRARDMLVVPVVGDEEIDGWVKPLYPAIYPEIGRYRQSVADPRCPTFGEDTVLERPQKALSRYKNAPGPERALRPGLHRPEVGDHEVVVWDPAILALGKEEDVGLRQQKILAPDVGELHVNAGAAAFAAWKTRRDDALARGVVPAFRTLPVTAAAEEAQSASGRAVKLEVVARGEGPSATGNRFGTLVHAVLAVADPSGEDLERYATWFAKTTGATADEVAAAVRRVRAAFAHELFARVRAADEVRREFPLTLELPDGRIAEGTVDLAFREGKAWVVVDYKTDADVTLGAARAGYEAQVGLYAQAIQAATGLPASAVLLVL